jgi:hypothetical protein
MTSPDLPVRDVDADAVAVAEGASVAVARSATDSDVVSRGGVSSVAARAERLKNRIARKGAIPEQVLGQPVPGGPEGTQGER